MSDFDAWLAEVVSAARAHNWYYVKELVKVRAGYWLLGAVALASIYGLIRELLFWIS